MSDPRRAQELLLVWKQPLTRQRYVVGRLARDVRGFHFRYERELPRSLGDALTAGFRLLESFPDEAGSWHDRTLFATFQRRLPPAWRRSDFAAVGADPLDAMEYFRRTGGRLATDSLEFLEPISEDVSSLKYDLTFPVAGWRYYHGERVLHELRREAKLTLELEPDNLYDPSAIRVLSPESATLIGYVPAIYAWYIDASIQDRDYEAVVADVGPENDPQVRLRVRIRGSLPGARLVPEKLQEYAETLAI